MIKDLLIAIVILFATAALYFFGIGFNHPIWPLIWIAPLPILLWSLNKSNLAKVCIVSFVAKFISAFGFLHYWGTAVPIMIFVPAAFLKAIEFSLATVAFTYFLNRLRKWYGLFIFPVIATTLSFVYFLIFPYVSNIAYSQINNLPVLQIISITGIWGVDFLLALFPAALAAAVFFLREPRQLVLSLFMPMTIIVIAIIYGSYQLEKSKWMQHKTIRVALLTVPETLNDILTTDPNQTEQIANKYIQQFQVLAKEKPEVILLPEKFITLFTSNQNQILSLFKEAAKKYHVMIIMGVNQILKDDKYNSALIIDTNGKIITHYHKHHMVHPFEDSYTKGKTLTLFPIKNSLAGVTICRDMDFIFPALNYARQDTNILFVPALDFIIDGWLHNQPALFRGIEGGFSVVRAAQWGMLSVSDANGKLLAWKETSATAATSLVFDVPMNNHKTFYSKFGDWFGWINMTLLCMFLVKGKNRAIAKRKKCMQ